MNPKYEYIIVRYRQQQHLWNDQNFNQNILLAVSSTFTIACLIQHIVCNWSNCGCQQYGYPDITNIIEDVNYSLLLSKCYSKYGMSINKQWMLRSCKVNNA